GRAGKPRASGKRTATAKKRATKRAAAKPAAKKAARPALRKAVAVRARKPARAAVTAFAAQRARATSREELLFELARARASVKAAIQGLTSASAMQPIAPRRWA